MAFIPRRRGKVSESSSNSSSSRNSTSTNDGNPSQISQLQLHDRHHRHTLDHSYFPEGNEDMNAATMFPNIPGADTNHADRIYADPYRQNIYIMNQNGQELFYSDEESGLFSASAPNLIGQ